MIFEKIGHSEMPKNQKLIVFLHDNGLAQFAMRLINEKGDDKIVIRQSDASLEDFQKAPFTRMYYSAFCQFFKDKHWAILCEPK